MEDLYPLNMILIYPRDKSIQYFTTGSSYNWIADRFQGPKGGFLSWLKRHVIRSYGVYLSQSVPRFT